MKKTFLISFICMFLDQLIKFFLLSMFKIGDSIFIINNFLNITLVKNTGAAFSILRSHGLLLIILSLVVLFSLGYYVVKSKDIKNYEYIIYGFLSGGILGNLIDRFFKGAVIDYLDFNILGYDAPVFNLADICIVVSMILILVLSLRDDGNEISSR